MPFTAIDDDFITSYCEDFATNSRFYLFIIPFIKGRGGLEAGKKEGRGDETCQASMITVVCCMLLN